MIGESRDFIQSLSLRAAFSIVLVGGAYGVAWSIWALQTEYWEEGPKNAIVCAGLFAGLGAIGLRRAFDSSIRMQNLLVYEMAVFFVLGVLLRANRHKPIRRFPVAENIVVGLLLILIWPFRFVMNGDFGGIMNTAACVGAVQFSWGLVLQARNADRRMEGIVEKRDASCTGSSIAHVPLATPERQDRR